MNCSNCNGRYISSDYSVVDHAESKALQGGCFFDGEEGSKVETEEVCQDARSSSIEMETIANTFFPIKKIPVSITGPSVFALFPTGTLHNLSALIFVLVIHLSCKLITVFSFYYFIYLFDSFKSGVATGTLPYSYAFFFWKKKGSYFESHVFIIQA